MRAPNLFDGIIAGAPIKQQTRGHVATAWSLHVLGEIAPKDDQGRPLLSKAYLESDIAAINATITEQCDALDGCRMASLTAPGCATSICRRSSARVTRPKAAS